MTQRAPRDRSRSAFEALYDRTAERLLGYLARRLPDPDTAAEIWAECWAAAFEQWPRCRAGSPAEAEAWLFGIARRRLADYYRTGAVRRRALDRLRWTVPALGEAEDEALARIVELDGLKAAVGDALDRLPAKRRQAVQLRIVGGLSYGDVAERMGCSEPAARAHVSRGLRRLAAVIDRNDRTRLEGPTP